MTTRSDLPVSRFVTALARLDDALAQPDDEFVRDAIVQRFEFSFELGWKAMQAHLLDLGTPTGAPRPAIRAAVAVGLLGEPDANAWLAMLDARNLTMHTYREEMAIEIVRDVRERHVATLHALAQAFADTGRPPAADRP